MPLFLVTGRWLCATSWQLVATFQRNSCSPPPFQSPRPACGLRFVVLLRHQSRIRCVDDDDVVESDGRDQMVGRGPHDASATVHADERRVDRVASPILGRSRASDCQLPTSSQPNGRQDATFLARSITAKSIDFVLWRELMRRTAAKSGVSTAAAMRSRCASMSGSNCAARASMCASPSTRRCRSSRRPSGGESTPRPSSRRAFRGTSRLRTRHRRPALAALDVSVTHRRVGRRNARTAPAGRARIDDVHRTRHGRAERLCGADVVIGRHHQHGCIGVLPQNLQRGPADARRRVPAARFQQNIVAGHGRHLTVRLLREPLVRHNPCAIGCDQRSNALHSRLKERVRPGQRQKLLRQIPTALRPEARAGSAGHDNSVKHGIEEIERWRDWGMKGGRRSAGLSSFLDEPTSTG